MGEGVDSGEKQLGTIWDIAEQMKSSGTEVDAITIDTMLTKAGIWPDMIDLGDFEDETQDKTPGKFLFETGKIQNLINLITGKAEYGTVAEITRALNADMYHGVLTEEMVRKFIQERDICPIVPIGETTSDAQEDRYGITIIAEGLAQKLLDKLCGPGSEEDDGITIEA